MINVDEFWGMSFDERKNLSHEELEAVLKAGIQEIIDRSEPTKRLKIQSIQSRCDYIQNTIKNPLVVASKIYALLIEEGLSELDAVLKGEHPSQHKSKHEPCEVIKLIR